MLHWYPLLFLLPSTISAIGHPRYECGEHGRFEYCIDGVPGCIVGCHCHPGYYFDTESKICEPNAKLVQEYRRMFLAEPTRVDIPMTPPDSMAETVPTPTTTNPLDNQVDAIAKDTDDLGDWLYNQFFKTIESQVINGTDKQKPYRRSDIGPLVKKPRKIRKKKKSSPKKIKIKNNDLRRKLLRITEDDSLFDSDSDSEETSGSSSSDSKSDTTAEEERDTHPVHPNDKEHGHRKILVINKKPKPPLPSFIFLPNIETPFYPPIGLPPPPPAIPMFPMVPVPPMPVYPYPPGPPPSTTEGNEKKEKEEKDKENKEREEKEEKERENKEKGDKPKEDKEKEDTEKKAKDNERSGTFRVQNSKRAQRKTLRQLQEKMLPFPRDERKRNRKLSNRNFVYQNTPLFDELSPQDVPMHDEIKVKPIEDSQVQAPPEDVNFKYLSQLIHKVNPNITKEDLLYKNLHGMKKQRSQPLRRTFETRYYNYDAQPEQYKPDQYKPSQYQPDQYQSQLNQHQEYQAQQGQLTKTIGEQRFTARQNEPDDSYYANLGHQIAALIRKVDSVGDRQVNVDLEPRENTPPQPVFNENSYSSRSYWERSVRSPLQHFRANTAEFDYIQRNYESLFNLEKKVEYVATTEHPLSLQEIENIVFLMDKAKSQLQENIKNIKTFKAAPQNLNINLLPRQIELLTTNQSNKVSFNLLPLQSEPSTTKQTSRDSFTKAISDDDISIPAQQSEILSNKSTSKVTIPKASGEDDISYLPKKTKLSNSKRRIYDIDEPIVFKKVDILRNKSNVVDKYMNTNNPQYNLRGILINNFRNVAYNNTIFGSVVPYTDLSNTASYTDFRNIGPDTNFRNVAFDTDYRNVIPISNLRNEELNTNFRNTLTNIDFRNALNSGFRTVHETDVKNIAFNTPLKNMVHRNNVRKNLHNKEFSHSLRNTNPKNILANANILRFLLQKGIRYKNQTRDKIQNSTNMKRINNSWNQEEMRQKEHRMVENLFKQETYKKSSRNNTPRNDIPPSFIIPFISNVKSMPKVPSTKRTYQINFKSDNSKDTSYINNNINKHGLVKETLPFESSSNIRYDKPTSYFHHELHFDYFE